METGTIPHPSPSSPNAKPDTAPGDCLTVRVSRGKGSENRYEEFQVPRLENQTVLDIVTWIQRNADPALSYRFACRVGVCGSCAMTVNGRPRWTCRTHVSKVIGKERSLTIEPLRNLPRIKDLAADMSEFFEKWQRAGGRFAGKTDRTAPLSRIDPGSANRKAVDAGIECINCAVCYSACDVVAWDADYLGPAALNRAWTLVNDDRHAEKRETMDKVSTAGGCHSCHSHGSCVEHCPVGVNPTAGIAGLKRRSVLQIFRLGGDN